MASIACLFCTFNLRGVRSILWGLPSPAIEELPISFSRGGGFDFTFYCVCTFPNSLSIADAQPIYKQNENVVATSPGT